MYTLGPGTILIKSIILVCRLNLMAWKASWAHRTAENGKKDDKIKKSRSKRRAPVVGTTTCIIPREPMRLEQVLYHENLCGWNNYYTTRTRVSG